MAQATKPKRAYTSARRTKQAEQTRQAILAAAFRLFSERGYASATIEAIAQAAGVAPETVYATFGSKLAVLRKLVDVTLVGDELPVALLDRPEIRAAESATSPRQIIESFARNIYQIMTRMSPIFALLRATAKNDPEIAALLERILQGRMQGMRYFIAQLQRSLAGAGTAEGSQGGEATPGTKLHPRRQPRRTWRKRRPHKRPPRGLRQPLMLHEMGQNRLESPFRQPAPPRQPPLPHPHPAPAAPGPAAAAGNPAPAAIAAPAAITATAADAAATAWALSSAEVFDLLTRDLGWSEEQYVTWLSESLARLLLA